MKKFLVLLSVLFIVNPCFSAVDINGINVMPYQPYEKKINLEKTSNAIYNKNNIKIEKNVYKFEHAYKLGIPYEYVITNNTGKDLYLKGIDSEYHANKNITRKSHWTRMCIREMKYWQFWVPLYDLFYMTAHPIDYEKNPYWRDFPKNYTIKSGESLRILALGLDLDKVQNLTFIFEDNGQEVKIEF